MVVVVGAATVAQRQVMVALVVVAAAAATGVALSKAQLRKMWTCMVITAMRSLRARRKRRRTRCFLAMAVRRADPHARAMPSDVRTSAQLRKRCSNAFRCDNSDHPHLARYSCHHTSHPLSWHPQQTELAHREVLSKEVRELRKALHRRQSVVPAFLKTSAIATDAPMLDKAIQVLPSASVRGTQTDMEVTESEEVAQLKVRGGNRRQVVWFCQHQTVDLALAHRPWCCSFGSCCDRQRHARQQSSKRWTV